ncbi:MAG TPA: 50S ribosomal protein L35 [Candidatus Hydrogenedentes bacterium]|nr:50S ribosomal protein L35 [Candidatus Hydrogenedentota bacterium]HPG68810.1 50S ribosomal protein L35 [Candidatus Hydrogenedentota bacterium]
MPKVKTHRGAAKRFRRTKSGKVKRTMAFARHLKSSKSPKRRRNLRKNVIMSSEDVPNLKKMLPYS